MLKIFFSFIFFLFLQMSLFADEIILKDGNKIEGKIVMQTSEQVVLNQDGKIIKIDKKEVESITKKPYTPKSATAEATSDSGEESEETLKAPHRSLTVQDIGFSFWPPELGTPYPNLVLYDHRGNLVELASFAGHVVLIELIGMTCPACQAFAGAHIHGGYKGVRPQQNLKSFEEYFSQETKGLSLFQSKVIYIQLILYNMKMQAPTVEEIKEWAHHFKIQDKENVYVLAGLQSMIGKASFDMIPGFQLLDKNLVLQIDSTGHYPKHNLYKELLPKVPELIQSKKTSISASKPTLNANDKKNIVAAYERVKVTQVTFDSKKSTLTPEEKAYLDRLFTLTDLILVQRTLTLDWFWTEGKQGKDFVHYKKQIDPLLKKLEETLPPEKLKKFHQLILEGVSLQKEFFVESEEARKKKLPFKFDRGHPKVQQSSVKLKEAYGDITRQYAGESEFNKKAFYAHLCCLDFI